VSKHKLYSLARVRSEDQRRELQQLENANVCTFCESGLTYTGVPIVKKGKHWFIAKNKFPYEGTTSHYMGIYREHVCSYAEVAPEAWPELFRLLKEFAGPECSIAMRSGDPDRSCATISHFHVHAFSGVVGHPKTHEEIIMHLGYKADRPAQKKK